ncbi:MAG: hypothetical protein H0X39_14785 [Actinobacteria bacterium]|nr:hypothetical protein [Actinomycetota bacterium]
MSNFDDLVDRQDLAPDEEARLRRVHELLVQAGPPPDLPISLERTPEAQEAEIVQFPLLPKRRWAVAAVVAATLVVLAFCGGYLFGHTKSGASSLKANRVIPMHGVASRGTQNALALLRLAKTDSVGNWPMELQVTGLPQQASRGASYELWLTKGGKPVEPCGTFRVHGKTTRVRFTVPYALAGIDGWVITTQEQTSATPGPVVVTT